MRFGQVVIGPPGSGKTSYCQAMAKLLKEAGRQVTIVNLDPANEKTGHEDEQLFQIDIMDLISVTDVMEKLHLGPNGALVYAMETLLANKQWLMDRLLRLPEKSYLLLDCPGQIELYTHHNAMRDLLDHLCHAEIRLCVAHLVDSHYCNDPGKYIAMLIMSLTTMLQMALPHVNVLTKIDLAEAHSDQLPFQMDMYTEVLDLTQLLDLLNEDHITKRYRKLNEALTSLIEDYGLVTFIPATITRNESLQHVLRMCDRANGYIDVKEDLRNSYLVASATADQLLLDAGYNNDNGANAADDRNHHILSDSDVLLWRQLNASL